MYFVFTDECGYQKNWKSPKGIQQQPVHVVAAAAISSDDVVQVYDEIRSNVRNLKLPQTDPESLGKGQEIKAASVDRGEGFWGKNQQLRDDVRRIYLDRPQVTYFVVCINKARLKVADPADLALRFLLERIQGFARERNEKAFVLIDSNKREEAAQRKGISRLLRWGSTGFGVSRFYSTVYQWELQMGDVFEIHFGDSKYSRGLQIADFVARHSYSWWKNNKDPNYPGWNYIEPKLYRYPYHNGWGYKEFPDGGAV